MTDNFYVAKTTFHANNSNPENVNAFKKWTEEEETKLLEELQEEPEISMENIALKHLRTASGIYCRCKKLARDLIIDEKIQFNEASKICRVPHEQLTLYMEKIDKKIIKEHPKRKIELEISSSNSLKEKKSKNSLQMEILQEQTELLKDIKNLLQKNNDRNSLKFDRFTVYFCVFIWIIKHFTKK